MFRITCLFLFLISSLDLTAQGRKLPEFVIMSDGKGKHNLVVTATGQPQLRGYDKIVMHSTGEITWYQLFKGESFGIASSKARVLVEGGLKFMDPNQVWNLEDTSGKTPGQAYLLCARSEADTLRDQGYYTQRSTRVPQGEPGYDPFDLVETRVPYNTIHYRLPVGEQVLVPLEGEGGLLEGDFRFPQQVDDEYEEKHYEWFSYSDESRLPFQPFYQQANPDIPFLARRRADGWELIRPGHRDEMPPVIYGRELELLNLHFNHTFLWARNPDGDQLYELPKLKKADLQGCSLFPEYNWFSDYNNIPAWRREGDPLFGLYLVAADKWQVLPGVDSIIPCRHAKLNHAELPPFEDIVAARPQYRDKPCFPVYNIPGQWVIAYRNGKAGFYDIDSLRFTSGLYDSLGLLFTAKQHLFALAWESGKMFLAGSDGSRVAVTHSGCAFELFWGVEASEPDVPERLFKQGGYPLGYVYYYETASHVRYQLLDIAGHPLKIPELDAAWNVAWKLPYNRNSQPELQTLDLGQWNSLVISFQVPYRNSGYLIASQNGRWGIINLVSGKWEKKPKYKAVSATGAAGNLIMFELKKHKRSRKFKLEALKYQ